MQPEAWTQRCWKVHAYRNEGGVAVLMCIVEIHSKYTSDHTDDGRAESSCSQQQVDLHINVSSVSVDQSGKLPATSNANSNVEHFDRVT